MLSKLKRNILAWYQLENWEKLVFLQLMAALLLVWPVLKLCSTKFLIEWVDNAFVVANKKKYPAWLTEAEYVQRVVVLIQIAGQKNLYDAKCLAQSVVLARYLRSQGIGVNLQMGVQKNDSSIRAHAWLSYEGNALGLSEDHYHTFSLQRGVS
jgi:Transglutaminase-like superfamily